MRSKDQAILDYLKEMENDINSDDPFHSGREFTKHVKGGLSHYVTAIRNEIFYADMWKVIGVDNFNRDCVSDFLYLDGMTEENAKKTAELLNEKEGDNSLVYYRAVPQTYRLSRGMHDLV